MTYCHTCQLPTEQPGQTLCGRDRQRLGAALTALYRFDPAELDVTRQTRGLAPTTSAPGFASRPPLDVDVLSLTVASPWARASRPLPAVLSTPRADPDMPGHARAEPLVITVGRWADRAREDDLLPQLRGGRTVAGEALRLSGVLDALIGRWWAAEALRELVVAADRVDRALGRGEDRRRAIPVGLCPNVTNGAELVTAVLGGGGAEIPRPVVCRGRVKATPALARCSRCGRAWHGEAMLRDLGRAMGGAYLDLAALARWTGETVPLLRQWAHRDGWRRQAHGRRKLFSLADAQTSWLKRRFAVGAVLAAVDETCVASPDAATMTA